MFKRLKVLNASQQKAFLFCAAGRNQFQVTQHLARQVVLGYTSAVAGYGVTAAGYAPARRCEAAVSGVRRL